LLYVEASNIVPRENAEGIGWHAVVALSARVELATLVLGIQTAEVGGTYAARDLTDITATGPLVLDVLGIGEEIGGELALVSIIVTSRGGAVCLCAGALGDADIGVGVQRSNQTHVRKRVDLDDVAGAVFVGVDIGSSTGRAGNEESDECKGVHDGA